MIESNMKNATLDASSNCTCLLLKSRNRHKNMRKKKGMLVKVMPRK